MTTVTTGIRTSLIPRSGPDLPPGSGHLSTLISDMRTDVVLRPDNFRERTIEWGQPWMYESPAYWVARAEESTPSDSARDAYRLGASFDEEVVACLLGGFGVTFELNVAAFHAIRDAGLIAFNVAPEPELIAELLARPLPLASGRAARYRFPNQKSGRIASALARLKAEAVPEDPLLARDWLLSFDGIGPKTASWIVRNTWPDIDVAIVDIHVWRAAIACGVFDPSWNPTKDYWEMEAVFVEWARHGGVSAAALDATIWSERAARARRRLRAASSR